MATAMSDWSRAILRPRSVALIGASDDASKTAGRPLQYLRAAGYAGKVYPINPRRSEVLGEKAWSTLADLPEVPEHAFILTGTDAAIESAAECGARGVKVATILASGFSEAGVIGAEREARLRDISHRTGIRLIGPSSLGVVNLHDGMTLTANAAFAEGNLPRGSTFVASHSGSMIGALLSRGKARGIGFSGLVSVGNEVDLSLGEICEATLDDNQVGSYMLFLESLNHADTLRRFALAAHKRGKPVLAYKLGRSSEAAELATSHTGALAGDDDIAEAFLRECGIARIETLDGFLEALPLLSRTPILASGSRPRVGVVTTTGGGAAMVVDQLGVRGISVAGPSDGLIADLTTAGAPVESARIVDLTLAGTRPEVMNAALGTMLASREYDLVVAVVGSSARNHPDLAVAPILEVAKANSPLAVFIVPDAPQALDMLARHDVPGFRTPESCADAIRAAFAREIPVARSPRIAAADSEPIDEQEAYDLCDRIGVERGATAILKPGKPVPALPFAFPVVAKVLSRDIAHKSDVGGVALGLRDVNALDEAARRICEDVRQHLPDADASRILVQPMERGIGEALIGYRVDPQVGPVVIVAAGGVTTEIYKDRALRLAPVTIETARAMIAEVKGFAALRGFRGKARGDLEALAQALVKFSRIGETEPRVMEAEINPILVRREGDGVVAVDALARLSRPRRAREDEV